MQNIDTNYNTQASVILRINNYYKLQIHNLIFMDTSKPVPVVVYDSKQRLDLGLLFQLYTTLRKINFHI